MGLLLTLLYIVVYYLSPPELFPVLAPYRVQLIMATLALIATIVVVLPARGYPVRLPQNTLVIGLLGTALFSRLAVFWFGGAATALFEFGAIIIIFFLLIANVITVARLKTVSIFIIGVAIYYSIMGVLSTEGYGSQKFLLEQLGAANDYYYRMRGLGNLNDPNDMAQVFLVAMALLGAFWIPRALVRNLIVIVPLMTLLLYGISLTKSRGAMLTLVVVILVWLKPKVNTVTALLLAAGGLFLLTAIKFTGRSMERDDGRLMAWSAAITMFKSHPLFGVGWNMFTEHHDLTTHNSYLLCLAELGTVGFFFWMSLVIVTFLQLNQFIATSRQHPQMEAALRLALSIRLALVSFLVSSWFLSRTYSMTLYILLAMATALVLTMQRRFPHVAFKRPVFRRYASLAFAGQVASLVGAYVMIQARLL
jgi:O-antigen ligase